MKMQDVVCSGAQEWKGLQESGKVSIDMSDLEPLLQGLLLSGVSIKGCLV